MSQGASSTVSPVRTRPRQAYVMCGAIQVDLIPQSETESVVHHADKYSTDSVVSIATNGDVVYYGSVLTWRSAEKRTGLMQIKKDSTRPLERPHIWCYPTELRCKHYW